MNLRFFTIEVERNAGIERSRNARPSTAQTRQQGRLQWIGLVLLVASSAIAAGWGGWLVAGGDPTRIELPSWVAFLTSSASADADDQARLEVISQPRGATVMLDGHRRGSTPLELQVAQGSHTLVLKHPDAIEEQRQITVAGDTTINLSMWLRRPTAMLLKPAYPGASIADAVFLEDGRLELSIAVPTGSSNVVSTHCVNHGSSIRHAGAWPNSLHQDRVRAPRKLRSLRTDFMSLISSETGRLRTRPE